MVIHCHKNSASRILMVYKLLDGFLMMMNDIAGLWVEAKIMIVIVNME